MRAQQSKVADRVAGCRAMVRGQTPCSFVGARALCAARTAARCEGRDSGWRRRANDAAQSRDCPHPGAGNGAGGSPFCRLGQLPRRVRGESQPPDRPRLPRPRCDRCPATADADPGAARRRVRALGRGQQGARAPVADRIFPGCDGARGMAHRRGAARRPGIRGWSRRLRPPRVAGPQARLRPRGSVDCAAADRRWPRKPRRCGERHRACARATRVQRRGALASGAGQRRGLLRRRRPALSLSHHHQPHRR